MYVDGWKKLRFAWSLLTREIVHINLQLLFSCNFHCRICDFWKDSFAEKHSLTIDQIRIISSKLSPIGPQVISIGGGEPLLHKDLVEAVRILSENNFPVMICNGWYITPSISRELFRAGIYEISVSVDYSSAEKHDSQRGMKGAFKRAVEGLRILQENRVYAHQRVHMISVIMDDNLDDVEDLIKLSRDLGVTYLVTLYSDNRGRKTGKSFDRDVSSHLLRLKAKYPEFVALSGYLGRFSEAIANGGISPCHAGENLINIDACGNVSFCIDDLENRAGNIFSDNIEKIRENLSRQRRTASCKGCWTSCRGSIETLMYGKRKLAGLKDYYGMTKDVEIYPHDGVLRIEETANNGTF